MDDGKRLFRYTVFKSSIFQICAIALLTALAGQFKIAPFSGELFRFSLGSIAFFLLILVWTPRQLIRTGVLTGMMVVMLRVVQDLFMYSIPLFVSFQAHIPALTYYVVFAVCFRLLPIEKAKANGMLLGLYAMLFESIGNVMEQLVRTYLFSAPMMEWSTLFIIVGIAFLRSYFVVGLYSSFIIAKQRERMEKMLHVRSDLYGETLYLQKSMNHIEKVTAKTFELSRSLKEKGLLAESKEALFISQEIHEVKKDSQRVLAGLLKVTGEQSEPLYFMEMVDLVIDANKKYSSYLQKEITFIVDCPLNFTTRSHIALLAIFNNLIANAVEAIEDAGEIKLSVYEKGKKMHAFVRDSAQSLSREDGAFIFEPGYTTKYNEAGVASTGIGLSHVKEIVHSLHGTVMMYEEEGMTVFEVVLPLEEVAGRGG